MVETVRVVFLAIQTQFNPKLKNYDKNHVILSFLLMILQHISDFICLYFFDDSFLLLLVLFDIFKFCRASL